MCTKTTKDTWLWQSPKTYNKASLMTQFIATVYT